MEWSADWRTVSKPTMLGATGLAIFLRVPGLVSRLQQLPLVYYGAGPLEPALSSIPEVPPCQNWMPAPSDYAIGWGGRVPRLLMKANRRVTAGRKRITSVDIRNDLPVLEARAGVRLLPAMSRLMDRP
jgi:hypothetical protein